VDCPVRALRVPGGCAVRRLDGHRSRALGQRAPVRAADAAADAAAADAAAADAGAGLTYNVAATRRHSRRGEQRGAEREEG
jgi:hypothetical protein